jgi:hypothetical protein
MRQKRSSQIALGGIFSALCLVLMFLTGLVPFATYALPALAGAMLVAVVIEIGSKMAILAYISVSILSLFVVPDREAAMMFIVFFGYYPILKEKLESIPSRILEYVLKLGLFNATIVAGYAVMTYLLGIPLLTEGAEDFGKYTIFILLLSGNVVFFIYDYALTRYISVYVKWFKPRFLRR